MYIRSSSEVLQQLVFGPAPELFASFIKMIKCYLIQSVIKNVLLSNLRYPVGRRSGLILCFIVTCATNQWPVCVCVSHYVYWLVLTALPGVYLSADTFFDGMIASQLCKTQSEKTSEEWSWDQTWRPDSKMVLIQARELEVGGLGGGRSHWSLITDRWFGQWGHSWSNTDYCN